MSATRSFHASAPPEVHQPAAHLRAPGSAHTGGSQSGAEDSDCGAAGRRTEIPAASTSVSLSRGDA